MSLLNDKKDIFTTIGAYTSLNDNIDLPDTGNIFTSVNNKNEILPFLLDTLKVTAGSDSLQQLTGEMLTNFIDTAEPALKTALQTQVIQYNSGDPILDVFKSTGNGISVPVKNIDIFGKFRNSPTSEIGDLLYNTTESNFDNWAYQAIQNANTDITMTDLGLIVKYNSTTDNFIFKATAASSSKNIGTWCSDYVNNATLINKKEFLTNILNTIYGSVTSKEKKTVEQVYNELQIAQILKQLEDDKSFQVSDDDYNKLLQKAQEMVDGVVYYDMGCGLIGASLSFDDLVNTINEIYQSNDPYFVGSTIAATIDKSTANVQETADENKESIKDGFFHKIIDAIIQFFVQILTVSPQIRTLLAIISSFQNNGIPKIGNPKEDLNKFKITINCLSREAKRQIFAFIFALIITFLVILLKPVIKKVIKEKTNNYIGTIQSLTSSKI